MLNIKPTLKSVKCGGKYNPKCHLGIDFWHIDCAGHFKSFRIPQTFFFLKLFWADTFTCPILGHWYRFFWFLVTSFLDIKARVSSALFALQRWMQCTFPWDPPLVLHVANLLTVSIVGWKFKTTAQCRYLRVDYPKPTCAVALHATTALCRLASSNLILIWEFKRIWQRNACLVIKRRSHVSSWHDHDTYKCLCLGQTSHDVEGFVHYVPCFTADAHDASFK